MSARIHKRTAVGIVILSMLAPVLFADDSAMEREAEQTVLSGGEGKVGDKIEATFVDFAGDNTEALVESLRTGGSLSYVTEVEKPVLDDQGNPVMVDVVNEDGTVSQVQKTELVQETIVVENSAGPLGFGGVVLALGLADATLPEGAEYKDIVNALFNTETSKGILDMRADGMGWGEIYHVYDLKVGDIMSAIHSARPDKVEKAVRLPKPEKPDRPEKVARPDKPAKPERPAKPEKPQHAARG